jgi:hypothetical protein
MLDHSPSEESNPMVINRPPLDRDVARPVVNSGNTCYMNAVLQALAHAPELCMAMDVKSHHANCPIYMENARSRRSSPSSSLNGIADLPSKPTGTQKSRRSGSGKRSPANQQDNDCKFCALREVEQQPRHCWSRARQ